MDFDEAARKYTELQVQRQKGSLTDQQYRTLVDQVRVQDGKGIWWQPDPGRTGWLFWNGTQWHPGTPRLPAPLAVSPAPAVKPQGSDPATTRSFTEFRAGIMDEREYTRISKDVPWNKRPQKWWDRFSIILGIGAAVVWFIYSTLYPLINLVTKSVPAEEIDFISPLLMVAMPLVLVWQRKGIDNFLMPLQPTRKKFSRKMLIGMGIAIPFLTAFIIYHVFQIDQYPLMYYNIVIGTLASYALVREPVLADKYQANPYTASTPDLKIPLFLLIGISLCVRIVLADDCLTSPLNARDCMRTTGTAELLAGGVSAGVSGAVNGPTMIQTLSDGGKDGGGSESVVSGDGGQDYGGIDDNPDTEFCGGRGPGGC